jgi:hypothetical protein
VLSARPEVVMRLSEWRASAPARDAVGPKVAAVVDPVLKTLGAEPDPHCWIAWGEEPANRFSVFVPTEPGLIACFVRVNVSGEGPRATSKLVRWNRVSIGELGVETQAGHRMLSFQLESQVLRGVDVEADRAAAFALRVIAAIDGRPLPAVEESGTRRGAAAGTAARSGSKAAAPNESKAAAPNESKAAAQKQITSGATARAKAAPNAKR